MGSVVISLYEDATLQYKVLATAFFSNNRLKIDKNYYKCCPWDQTISAI